MARRLHALGYWFNDAAPSGLPRPQALIGRWPVAARRAVVAYLRGGAVFERYRAWSFCRFKCGAPARTMGRHDLSDGVWVWPEGLAHYVADHGVRLPPAFVAHALAHRGAAMPLRPWGAREGLIDERRWRAWGRAEGACLDLRGWAPPDWAAATRIATVLAAAGVRGEPLLVRGDEVVVRRGGGLARIRRRPFTVTAVAGWDAWPGLPTR
jgi:hypothetical protein